MKSRLSVVALALSTLIAGHALAADATIPKTRAEVRAELAEAIRDGSMMADGQTGATFKDLYPSRYAQPVASGKTREEVKAELAEAIRNGDMVADGQTGVTFKQLNPDLYPQQAVAQSKTRGEVRAELDKSRTSNGG
jgi:hypothetical protein